MTPGHSPTGTASTPRRKPGLPWKQVLLAVGGTVAVGVTAVGLWGWQFLRREIPPFLEDNISDALGRPLKLGEFERFTPSGIRLGPSILPPTADNFTWAKAKAVDISFNPFTLVFRRTLRPKVIFVEPEIAIKQGFDRQWAIQPPDSAENRGLIKTELAQLQVRRAHLSIGPVARRSIVPAPQGVVSSALITLQNVNIRLRFFGEDNQQAAFVAGGRLNSGSFQLRGEGELDTRRLNLLVRAQQIPVSTLNPLLGGNAFVRDGLVSCNLIAQYRPGARHPLDVRGAARLRQGEFLVADLPASINNINGTLVLNGTRGTLQNSSLKYGPIQVEAKGTIDAAYGYNVSIEMPDFSLAELEEAFAQPLPVENAGHFHLKTLVTGALFDPQVRGQFQNLTPVRLDRLGVDSLVASFSADLRNFTLDSLALRPTTGGLITAQGQADFTQDLARPDLAFTARTDVPIDGIAALYDLPLPETVRLGSLLAEAQLIGKPDDFRASALWQVQGGTFPGQGQLAFANNLLTVENSRFQIGSGTLTAAASANLNNQDWQARVAGSALPLGLLSPRLRGFLDTTVQASGRLTSLTLAETRAAGTLHLTEAIPLNLDGAEALITGPLMAAFAWEGDRLVVPEVTAPNLYASGMAEIRTPAGAWPQVGALDFSARLTHFNLGAAYSLLDPPDWLTVQGFADFDGRLQGTFRDPHLVGIAGLRQFAINNFALRSDVSGPLQASLSTGASINLQGDETEIVADIAPNFLPHRFRLRNGEMLAVGTRQETLLSASVQNLDLSSLRLRSLVLPELGTVSGLLNANAEIDLSDLFDPDGVARFAIANPALGPLTAHSLTGRLQYRDGTATLSEGIFQVSETAHLLLTAQGRLFPSWAAEAEVIAQDLPIQELLALAGVYRFEDFNAFLQPKHFGTAAAVATQPVGDPENSLLAQADLARTLRQQTEAHRQKQVTALIPDLDQLSGAVSGRLMVHTSEINGIRAQFDFFGQNWAWGRYDFDNQFVARGRLSNRALTLDPIEFHAADTRLSLLGTAALEESNLQIQAENLPLDAFATLAEVPIEVTGDLTLAADLTGSWTNPQLVGDLSVEGASLNQQPLEEISSRFQYQDASLSVEGRVQGPAPEPLLFGGTVPYALPFMTTQPDTDQIALRASLQDDGLALINLFTPLITWGGGKANIDIHLGGTIQQPLISGIAAFQDATFNSPLLEDSLTHLTGALRFEGDHLHADNLSGDLMEGAIALSGTLPLYPEDAREEKALVLDLHTLRFNYADELKTTLDGQVRLANAVLDPAVGGGVHLQNTTVQVGPELRRLVNEILAQRPVTGYRGTLAKLPGRMDQFRILLDPTMVKAYPLFSFDLMGDVSLNGPFGTAYADGFVTLIDGWINTVTAEFSLVGNRENVALFSAQNPWVPYLDLRFSALVPLQRQYNVNPPGKISGNTAEIPDLASLESNTVFDELQIDAIVKGYADHLFDNLQLVSNPPRSQTELLSMVSGGYLSDLNGGEPSLALVSNALFALSAGTQDSIGDALGISRFRVGASTVLPSEDGDTLGYGIGLNLDITDNLSTTLIQVLNQSQPIQFNVRYRIDNQWGIGASSDFGDDSRMFLEYRVDVE